jgi:hypothetical protein
MGDNVNRFVIGIGAAISLLIATDLIIHRTDGDSLIVSLTQIEEITFPTVNDTTYLISGDSLSVPLSQIDKITFSNVNDTPPTADTILVYPGDDINSIVDNNPEGTTFIIKSGIHSMQEIWPKNGNTFWGETGAILNGGRVLTEFVQEGGLYYAPDQTQEGQTHVDPYVCPENWERCDRPEVLYFDNEPLRHVTSLADVESGKYYFDYDADRIYFADDPTGHTVETSITTWAFVDSGNDITIKYLIIEKYASVTDFGTVGASGLKTNWLVEGCEIRLNHGAGIVVGGESTVRGNYLHHNGHVGVNAGGGANILIESNEISYNNFTRVSMGWGGAATKFYVADNLQVIGNYVHHNIGHGLWTDIGNTNTLYEGNWVWWNLGDGIKHEISHNVIIRNNDVRYNGLINDVWLWGSQILIQTSNDAEVYDNVIFIDADIGNGIGIMHTERTQPPWGPFDGKNNYIHHNEITHLGLSGGSGIVDGSGDADYDGDGEFDWACGSEANNLFDYNSYHHNGIPEKFEFCETYSLTLEQFQAAGQDIHGTMDSNVIIPDDTPPQVCPICPGL